MQNWCLIKMASTSESDTPSVSNLEEKRSRLCDEFAAIAGTESAVAQCYLAENDWEMEVHTPAECNSAVVAGVQMGTFNCTQHSCGLFY